MAEMSNDYGNMAYWEERYKARLQDSPEQFGTLEWYKPYSSLKPIFRKWLLKGEHTLVLGSGESKLGGDMAEEGYSSVVNCDCSETVVAGMARQWSKTRHLEWTVQNACALSFLQGTFAAVVDKATLDSILCGDPSFEKARSALQEVRRVLSPRGVFISVSVGEPRDRLLHLEQFDWDVELHTVEKSSGKAHATPIQLTSNPQWHTVRSVGYPPPPLS